MNAFFEYGESPFRVCCSVGPDEVWRTSLSVWLTTPFFPFSTPAALLRYCSTEKHWGLLKNARSLVAMCILRWQGKAGRNEMQVSLEAFSLQKSFCNISSSYISYLVMNVWNMQMCQNIKVENKWFVRYIYFIVIIFQLIMYFIPMHFSLCWIYLICNSYHWKFGN